MVAGRAVVVARMVGASVVVLMLSWSGRKSVSHEKKSSKGPDPAKRWNSRKQKDDPGARLASCAQPPAGRFLNTKKPATITRRAFLV